MTAPNLLLNEHAGSLHLRYFLYERVTVVGDCWLWQKCIGHNGYGTTRFAHIAVRAHRASYVAWIGPIPDGLVIDHLCRVRACINPEHLEAVTVAENNRRGEPATRSACVNGHEYSGDSFYLREGRRVCRPCRRAAKARLATRKRTLSTA